MLSTTARWMAPLHFAELTTLHPLVHLVIVEGTSTSLEESILSGRLDLAVVDTAERDSGLKLKPLFDEDLLLVVLPGHPLFNRDEIDLAELDGMDLMFYEHLRTGAVSAARHWLSEPCGGNPPCRAPVRRLRRGGGATCGVEVCSVKIITTRVSDGGIT
jgi:DNA-binding transcriptional LysR family regulator